MASKSVKEKGAGGIVRWQIAAEHGLCVGGWQPHAQNLVHRNSDGVDEEGGGTFCRDLAGRPACMPAASSSLLRGCSSGRGNPRNVATTPSTFLHPSCLQFQAGLRNARRGTGTSDAGSWQRSTRLTKEE